MGSSGSTPGVAVARNVSRKHALEMLLTDARRCRDGEAWA